MSFRINHISLTTLVLLSTNLSGAGTGLEGAASRRQERALFGGDQPAVSPDGKWIAYRGRTEGNFEVFVAPLDAKASARRITNHPARDGSPTWSPDGRSLCFVSDRSGNKDLWVADLDRPEAPRRLTSNPGPDEDPAWSPDGALIAYVAVVEGSSDIFVVPARGGDPIPLTRDRYEDSHPTWSSDGRRLAFVSDRQELPHVWMLDLGPISERGRLPADPSASGRPFHLYQITSGSFEDSDPAWCPGSDLVAFSSERTSDLLPRAEISAGSGAGQPGTRRIFFASTGPGGHLMLLSQGQGRFEQPAWVPGGRDLVVVSTPLSGRGEDAQPRLLLIEGAR